jgi:FtsP/CotA-like multicopper oxidase with cupredoxin domain
MNQPQIIFNRRNFLRLLGGMGTLTALGALNGSGTSQAAIIPAPQSLERGRATSVTEQLMASSSSFVPDVELALRAVPSQVSIFSGQATSVWSYQGEVLKGSPSALQFIEGSYLGPIIRVRKGQKVRIHFTNKLSAQSIIHWHGLHVPEAADGHPRQVISSGQTYVYEFEVRNRAGTYWYHPHPHGQTGYQVNMGLAGLFVVSDDEEMALGLPSGDYDLPLVIQDRLFNANKQFVYLSNGMMERMTGFLGDRVLVNGQADFTLPVATRAYRLRLLNASNSRIYKLAWQDGTPLTVIGTDGGLLEAARKLPYVTLAPGQRIELWANFSGYPVGTEMVLLSLPFDSGEMMGGMMGGSSLSQGAVFRVLTARVERVENNPSRLPQRLTSIPRLKLANAVNGNAPRTFSFAMQQMSLTINGRTFDMEGLANDEIVRLNTLELWELANDAGMMGGNGMNGQGNGINGQGNGMNGRGNGMMGRGNGMNGRGNGMNGQGNGTNGQGNGTNGQGNGINGQGNGINGQGGNQGGMGMPHPVHIHGLQFQIVERQVASQQVAAWQTVSDGYVDEGWHDTVLVMPGERVKLLLKFEDYEGLFLYHCHNLEHEDMGMMRNYLVRAS